MTEPTFKVDDGLQAEYDGWLTYGWKGVFVYLPKEIAVRIVPRSAPRLITFTSSMLCKRAEPGTRLTFGSP
ncbi:MAG: hypothetical protein GY851_17565 [bacterium]|nr:hypothetical protein [bacterium]